MSRIWVVAALLALLVVHASGAGADGGARGEGLVAGFGSIWTTGENGLVRIDPQQARVVAAVRTDPSDVIPSLAAGEGSVWSLTRRSLTRIDPGRDRAFGAPVRLPAFSSAVAAGAGALWVVDYDSGILRKLDARDGRELAAIPAWARTPRRSSRRPARSGSRASAPGSSIGTARSRRPGRGRHARRPAHRPDRRPHPGRSRPWRARGRRWGGLGDELSRPATRLLGDAGSTRAGTASSPRSTCIACSPVSPSARATCGS